MMLLTIQESPVLGGGGSLPSRPSRTGDFVCLESKTGMVFVSGVTLYGYNPFTGGSIPIKSLSIEEAELLRRLSK